MNPLFITLIKPIGERYNNTQNIGGVEMVMNTTISAADGNYTNRIGEVKAVPKDSILQVGDKVIVHHNVFRQYWSFNGVLMDNGTFVEKDTFQCGPGEIYAYDRGDGWKTLEDYCFVKPTENELWGTMKYFDSDKINVEVGDLVAYTPYSEHKFWIDGELLYRMRNLDIILKK